jgi:Ca2+-binding RTX toxin-like protein
LFTNAVFQFDVSSGGRLLPKSPPTVSAGDGASGVAVSPLLPTARDDALFGTAGDNVICALGGADVVRGLAGDDTLAGERCGGRASVAQRAFPREGTNDRLDGGEGADLLHGGPGRDLLRGGAGNDRLDGARGADRLLAGAGRDRVNARDGRRDRVSCGAGRDAVRADGPDQLRGCERIRR